MKRALCVCLVAACGGSDVSQRDLVVRGAPGAALDDHLVEVAVLDADGAVLAEEATAVVEGAWQVGFPALLDEGSSYEVLVYVDVSDDLACQPPPADLGWRLAVGPVEGTEDVETPGEGDADVCSAFDEAP